MAVARTLAAAIEEAEEAVALARVVADGPRRPAHHSRSPDMAGRAAQMAGRSEDTPRREFAAAGHSAGKLARLSSFQ